MRILPLVATLGLLVPTLASAADNRPPKPKMEVKLPPFAPKIQIFDFPTGLRILMLSDRSYPIVSFYMMTHIGSANDPEGLEETAHFVEHMWFRSKHTVNGRQLPPIMTLLSDVGANFNASTWPDITDYKTVVDSKHLDLMMHLESRRLTEFYIGVTNEEIETEREVIRNEWRRRNEQNVSLALDYLAEAVYPEEHLYHSSSTHETIDNINLETLKKFVDAHYKPAETTYAIVGDFDPQEASSLIFSHFDKSLLDKNLTDEDYFKAPKFAGANPDNPEDYYYLAWDPATRGQDKRELFKFSKRTDDMRRVKSETPPLPPPATREIITRKAPIEDKIMLLGWSLPGGYRDDTYNMNFLGSMLGNTMAQGFPDERRRKEIGGVYCFPREQIDATTLACIIEMPGEKLDPKIVRDQALNQISELLNPELAADFSGASINGQAARASLQRSKLQLLADLLLGTDNINDVGYSSLAQDLAQTAHYTNSPKAISDAMKKSMNIDIERVQDLVREFVKRDRVATVMLEPLSEDEIDTTAENSSYEGASNQANISQTTDDLDKITDEDIAKEYLNPIEGGVVDFKLDNGMRVIIKHHTKAPLVQSTLVFGRNLWNESPDMNDFAARMSQSVGVDPLPIAGETSYWVNPPYAIYSGYAKPLYTTSSTDFIAMDIRAPANNLDAELWILREELETITPKVEWKPAYLEQNEASIKRQWSSRSFHSSKEVNQHLYGADHALGRSATWDDLVVQPKTWGREEVSEYISSHLQPSNATLFIVGNIDPEEAKAQAEKQFGGWKGKGNASPPPKLKAPKPQANGRRILIYDDPKKTQSQITTSCRLNYSDSKDAPGVQILGDILRSKIFTQLRVKEGLAYSPYAYTRTQPQGTAAFARFASLATNSGVGRTIEYFHEAITELEDGKVDDTEVKLNKLRAARGEGIWSQSISQMTGTLRRSVLKGQSWEQLADYGQLIADVNEDQMARLMQGCKENTITTIIGPKDVITAQLDERGMEYEIAEWQASADELYLTHDPKGFKKKEKKRLKDEKKAKKKKAKTQGKEPKEKKEEEDKD